MALTMDSGGLRDLSAPSSTRQESTSATPPFSNSRLRGYAGRMEGMLDPKIVLGSSIALTAAGMVDPFPPMASGGASPRSLGAPSPLSGQQQRIPESALTAAATGSGRGASTDLQPHPVVAHHARFAPAPAVFTTPPGGASSAGSAGGGLHSASRFAPEQSQRPPPVVPTAAWPAAPAAGAALSAAAAAAAAASNPEDLAAALSQIQALKAEIAGVETVLGYLKGSETTTTTMGRKAHKLPSQEQLRVRADALAASRAAARLGGGSSAGASIDPLLLAPLRSSTGHGMGAIGGGGGSGPASTSASPARAKSAGDAHGASAGGGGGGGGTAVFDTLAAETKLGRTWRMPRGPQPVGRGEAVILEAALDEALPAGAITAKYGSGAAVELSFWSGGDVRQDFEMLEMVQREVARQVSVSCVERGRIIEKLADRHSEIFVAVVAAAKAAAEAQRNLTDELAAVRARAVEQASEIATLRAEMASRGAEAEDLREQLAEATTAHEHYVWDTEQELEQLQGQADILAAEVEHLHVRLAEAVAEKDAALSRGLERLEGDLEAVTDERDDLAQRIRFLERQLHKLRTEMNTTAETVSVEVQTDPIDWGPVEVEDVPDDVSDTPSLAEIRARYASLGYAALTPEERIRLGLPPHMGNESNKERKGRKRKRALGHFQGLISSDKPGRVRGLPWTMNVISAMYYDKVHADTVSDRENRPRQRLAEFAVDWHMTRFGLRNLAELHLLDLIASVRQHYKTSVRVRWFGQFTGLVEVGDSVDTTPHVSFYLTVLQHLAAPNSLVSLFPDTGGEEGGGTPPVAIKAAALPEATRAVFRYLGEPEGAAPFLARAVDPITDPTTQLAPLDPLVALFMAEYQKRWERNAAHLRALFRAGDFDDDGLIGYDEFVAVVRQVIPADTAERMATKMYGDAVKRLPEGQSLVDVDTFLAVARAFGLDRWRIDVATVAGAGPASTSTATSGGGVTARAAAAHYLLGAQSSSAAPLSTFASSVGGAAAAAAAAAVTPRPGSAAGSGGPVGRTESALARSPLGAAVAAVGSAVSLRGPPSSASAVSQPYTARTVSNLRREDSVVGLSDADRALLRVLDGALEGLDPSLDDQVLGLLEKLRGSVATAQQQAAAAASAAAAVPGLDLGPSTRDLNTAIAADSALISKLEGQLAHFHQVYAERTDPAAAWLSFRLLLASLAAATAGPRARTSRGRPGSAKGTVGWGVPRTVLRLTIPPLPFRAGSGSRALTSGGTAPSLTSRRGSPQTLSLGMGLGTVPSSGSFTGSLQQPLMPAPSGSAGGDSSGGLGMAVALGTGPRAPSPLSRSSSRSPGRSPDLPGRPVGLAQMIQGTVGNSFAERQGTPTSLVIPSPTGPVPLHRAPLPATLSSRGSALTSAGGGINTPTKRGVMFSLGTPPAPPAPLGGAAAPQAVALTVPASATAVAPAASAAQEDAPNLGAAAAVAAAAAAGPGPGTAESGVVSERAEAATERAGPDLPPSSGDGAGGAGGNSGVAGPVRAAGASEEGAPVALAALAGAGPADLGAQPVEH